MNTQTQIDYIVKALCDWQIRDGVQGQSKSGYSLSIVWIDYEQEFQMIHRQTGEVLDIILGLDIDIQSTLEDLAEEYPDLIDDIWHNLDIAEYCEAQEAA